ncbi:hypothetical protein VPH35_005461 [Triticum aestivum]
MMETFLLHHKKAKAGSMAGSGDPALGSTQLPCYGWPSVAHPFCLSDVKVHPFFLSDVKVWTSVRIGSDRKAYRQREAAGRQRNSQFSPRVRARAHHPAQESPPSSKTGGPSNPEASTYKYTEKP